MRRTANQITGAKVAGACGLVRLVLLRSPSCRSGTYRHFAQFWRSAMHMRFMTSAAIALTCLAAGCGSPGPATDVPSNHASPVAGTSPWISRSVPPDLPTFGTPTTNSVRVAVFGMANTVRRPGFYHLPRGAVVRDAVAAAKGLSEFTWWRRYSGIERQKPDGTLEVIRFTRDRAAEEQIVFQDGDRIYFGHEVY